MLGSSTRDITLICVRNEPRQRQGKPPRKREGPHKAVLGCECNNLITKPGA